MQSFMIPGNLDTSSAPKAKSSLVNWFADLSEENPEIEIDTMTPTQVSLQLLVAAHRKSETDDRSYTFGPNACAHFDQFLKQDGD
jgi:predicted SnoaL-like aldol condensation-catalyzing enzyme